MILNLSDATALALLSVIDTHADELLNAVRKKSAPLPHVELHNSVVLLQHLGIVKHRIEVNLGLSAFRGPIEWGLPLHGKQPQRFK